VVALSLATSGGKNGLGIARNQLVDRITNVRKAAAADVSAAISQLENAAALVTTGGQVTLTDVGQSSYNRVRARVDEVTEYVFDLPAEDLAAAGRILATITARANAVLASTSPASR
jgi:hypothetical protein